MHLNQIIRQHKGVAEGLPPPPTPVDENAWRGVYPDEGIPKWRFKQAAFQQPSETHPSTILWLPPEEGNILYAIVNNIESWEEHFASRGWLTPEDQINAGFPFFLQPTFGSGIYEEEWDIESVVSNAIVNIDFSTTVIAGQVSVTSEISTSVDGASWTPYVVATSLFVSSLRYVRVRFTFNSVE